MLSIPAMNGGAFRIKTVTHCEAILEESTITNNLTQAVTDLKKLAEQRVQLCDQLTSQVETKLRSSPIGEGVPKLSNRPIKGQA